MPKEGDCYIVEIKEAHIDWGRHRNTDTRDRIPGEAYVQIPKAAARAFGIETGKCYTAVFADGFESFMARASGTSHSGDVYAKQFQGAGDLKAFGRWYNSVGAKVGDKVAVVFLSENKVMFTLIP